MREVMDYSFSEKKQIIEYQASDEARLLQEQVNNFKQYTWPYDSPFLWYKAEVLIIIKDFKFCNIKNCIIIYFV